ncbi:LysR family transcriptional regulator substrate-binding protein [Cupriavidus plantarum]|uniref:LysR family transcriptional regulator substrate-binding protein n=1 Tax=Cupriavidus plantarum TaxID=942865 RepID=UPI000E22FE0F|nr:LysR family transcriptional regulator substrate-binding protein [Cupriavidus plantarum]
MTRALRANEMDLAIAYQPTDAHDMVFEPLCDEELVLFLPGDHALARRKRVRMIELHGRDRVMLSPRHKTRQIIDDALDSAGTVPNGIIESGTIPSLLNLVRETGAPTILSRYALTPGSPLRTVPLESPRPTRTTGLIYSSRRARTPLETAFGALLRKVAVSDIAA